LILSFENLSVAYDSGKLFSDVSASASDGQVIALVGRNGTGKSTLLRCLLGLQKPDCGRVLVDGEDVHTMSVKQRARFFSYVSTYTVDVAYLTASDVVSMGCRNGNLPIDEEKVVRKAMESVSISNFSERYLSTLSDGERQRVMIARAVAQCTPVMVLDEPTAFLDVPNRIQIHSFLRSLSRDFGKIVILSTHEIELAKKYADFFWLMEEKGLSSFAVGENNLPDEFSV